MPSASTVCNILLLTTVDGRGSLFRGRGQISVHLCPCCSTSLVLEIRAAVSHSQAEARSRVGRPHTFCLLTLQTGASNSAPGSRSAGSRSCWAFHAFISKENVTFKHFPISDKQFTVCLWLKSGSLLGWLVSERLKVCRGRSWSFKTLLTPFIITVGLAPSANLSYCEIAENETAGP